ncbi:hypothetical protein [Actinomyces oris]|nr:hypothetical protein [Actinomyces oris]
MLPATPRLSLSALTVLWKQVADDAVVETGIADHFDRIFRIDAAPGRF